MIEIYNITQRLWYLYYVNSGIYLFSLNIDKNFDFNTYLPGFKDRYECAEIASFANSDLIPDKIKHDFVGSDDLSLPIFQKCRGIMFNDRNDLFKLLNEWNYFQRKQGQFPLLVFSRDTLNAVKLNCVVSNMCIDANFLQSELPNSEYMYRNQATLTNALSVPAPILPTGLIRLWNNWINNKNIFGYSKKYYCAEYYGYPTKLNLLRGKNLFKEPQNKDMVRYLLFHTLVMNKYDIEKLQDIGFIWNRYNQVWAGAGGSVNEPELRSFIANDNMATPDTMGFVPEWYAHIDIAKHSTARERGGNKYDNTVLWRQFLSY